MFTPLTFFSYPVLGRALLTAGILAGLTVGGWGQAEVPAMVQRSTMGSMEPLDRLFLWICAILGLVMVTGFYLMELGHVRAKNSVNVGMKHLLNVAALAVVFLFSYVFMFGNSSGGWIGTGGWDYVTEGPLNDDLWIHWLLHFTLAAVACAVATTALAERARFAGSLIFAAVFAAVIYPLTGHWAWGSQGGVYGVGGDQGWLEQRGFHDFAGATVVHGIGGACALAGLLVAGRRSGKFGPQGLPRLMPGHNLPLTALGAFCVWLGSFGILARALGNPGAELGGIMVNLVLAGAMGCLGATICRWVVDERPDVAVAIQGTVAGLVSITAACDVVSPRAALMIGLCGGLLAVLGSLILHRLRVDDAVNAVPVHFFAGVWGTLAVALFHRDGFDPLFLSTQAIGSLSLCLAGFSVAFLAFKALDLTLGLRAAREEQEDGLDFSQHAANAYPDFVTTQKD